MIAHYQIGNSLFGQMVYSIDMSFANRPGSLTITGTSTLRWFSYAAVAHCLGLFLQRDDAQPARALPEIISLTEAELSSDLGQRYQA